MKIMIPPIANFNVSEFTKEELDSYFLEQKIIRETKELEDKLNKLGL